MSAKNAIILIIMFYAFCEGAIYFSKKMDANLHGDFYEATYEDEEDDSDGLLANIKEYFNDLLGEEKEEVYMYK